MSYTRIRNKAWLMSMIDTSGECWPWKGHLSDKGYGVWETANPRRRMYAHRTAYELLVGSVPDGLQVLHACDNPPCCRPDHLWLGTHADNMADMKAKGRAKSGGSFKAHPGERNGNAKLNEAAVKFIRAVYKPRHPEFGARALGRHFDVSHAKVSQIVLRKAWAHV